MNETERLMVFLDSDRLKELQTARNPQGTAWLWDYLPATPPPPWKLVKQGEDGYSCLHRYRGLRLIASGGTEQDGHRWLHISVSYPNRMPEYQDLADAKRDFIGPDRYAYQVFAAASEHVNIHPFVLHLWSCVDVPRGLVLPDFPSGLGTI